MVHKTLTIAITSIICSNIYAEVNEQVSKKDEHSKLQTIVVTASGNSVDTKEAPASISVITAEEIKKRPVSSLADVLKNIPGVTGGLSPNGAGSKISLRGLDSKYTLILVDGKRIGSSTDTNYREDLGRQDLNWISPDMIERIEVVRGPMSSLYGSDAMGGVINIITKKIQDHWGGSFTYNYTQPTTSSDRGRTFQSGLNVSGPISDYVGVRLNASQTRREADDNYKNVREGRSQITNGGTTGAVNSNFGAQFNIQPNNENDITLETRYGIEKNIDAKNITNINMKTGDKTPNQSESWGPSKLETHNYIASWDSRWGNDIRSSLSAYYNDYDQSAKDTKAKSNESTIEGKINLPFDLIIPNQLTIGGQWKREELTNTETIGTVPGSSYDGQSYSGNNRLAGESWALFLENTLSITDQLKLTLGDRYDKSQKFSDHHSPRGYLVYNPNDDWTFKGGVSKGFRAPTIKESTAGAATQSRGGGCGSLRGRTWLDENNKEHIYTNQGCYMAGNANLKPETSTNYEISAGYTGYDTNVNLTYFYTDFKNKIDYMPLGYYYGNFWTQMRNIQKARTQGLEATIGLPLNDQLRWKNTATYFIDAKNLDTDEALISTPKLKVISSLDYQITDPLAVNVTAEYTGKQYTTSVTNDQTLQPAHTIFSLATNYQVNEDLTVRAGINNLFDKKFSRSSSSYYVERQAAYLGMTYNF